MYIKRKARKCFSFDTDVGAKAIKKHQQNHSNDQMIDVIFRQFSVSPVRF